MVIYCSFLCMLCCAVASNACILYDESLSNWIAPLPSTARAYRFCREYFPSSHAVSCIFGIDGICDTVVCMRSA